MERLVGRTVLVTGSTGIAAAGARRFAAEGARVFVTSRTPKHCAGLVAGLVRSGAEVAFLPAGLADEAQADAVVAAAVARFGRLDGLFAVAGGSGCRSGDGPPHEVTLEALRQTLDLNLTTQFLVARAVLRQMLAQPSDDTGSRGALVMGGSVLASRPVAGLFETHAYATSKGAIATGRGPGSPTFPTTSRLPGKAWWGIGRPRPPARVPAGRRRRGRAGRYLETADDVAARAELVLRAGVPVERLTLVPDCGFSPSARWTARAKLRTLVAGRDLLLGRVPG